MGLMRLIGRPLLASMFVIGGVDAFRHPESKAPVADKTVAGLVDKLPVVSKTEHLVRLDAAVKILGGTGLALGVFPRLSALALVGSMVPTTLAGHSFWEETDPAKKKMQKIQFFKNLSMTGGLLVVAGEKPASKIAKKAERRVLKAARMAVPAE